MIYPKTVARRAALRALVASEKVPFSFADFSDIEAASRPFAHEIYAGTNRQRALLDYQLALPLGKKSLAQLDAPVRAALRLGAFEFYFLKVPIHAVGNAYVELIKAQKLSSASGFLNAIFRALKPEFRPLPQKIGVRLPIEFSHPAWLVDRYLAALGEAQTQELLRANNSRAPLCLRVNTLQASREEILGRLENATPGKFSPDAINFAGNFDAIPRDLWESGALFVQDEAAQLVSFYAAPNPGDFVLDLTGAPGGKATHLAQMVGENGRVLVCDLSEKRLEKVRENAARLQLSNIETLACDAREIEGLIEPVLARKWETEGTRNSPLPDVVLLDAPCLGTGTFRRRPDARWRKTPEQLSELQSLQADLLRVAARLVAPRGALVYSTCSLEPEENTTQARNFSVEFSGEGWEIVRAPKIFGALQTSEGWLQSWPHRDVIDGMFAAKWRRTPEGMSSRNINGL